MSVLSQVLPLVGVLIGALATFAFALMTERTKWKRTQATRWDEKRLTTYMEYASALKKMLAISNRMAATRGVATATAEPIPLEEGHQLLAAAEADRSAKWETVQLLGDPPTVAAARSWHEAVWELEWFARGRLTGDEEFELAYRKAGAARTAYYTAARADLGVSSGVIPDRSGLPAALTVNPLSPGGITSPVDSKAAPPEAG
jgi:hypothetical protein